MGSSTFAPIAAWSDTIFNGKDSVLGRVASFAKDIIDMPEQAKKQREAMERAAQQQYEMMQNQQQELADQKKQMETDKANAAATAAGNEARDAARKKKGIGAGSGGMKSNVLTSPLGEVAQGQTAGKTLLGT